MRTVPRLSGRSTISGHEIPENGCSGGAIVSPENSMMWHLHVGRRGGRVGAEEAARIGRAHREQAAPAQQVIQPGQQAA